ncbi:quinone-dependent dihydroorotate dehydrogenase [soil metagenome]
MNFYTSILRPLLFRMDAESAHHFALKQLAVFPPALLRMMFGSAPQTPAQVMGISFPNRVGLAAGMDKNAVALPGWEALGFGFVEIGTVTALAQPGNPQPRLFRYPEQAALINRMGFNNDGADAVAGRLKKLKDSGRWPRIPVGINLGKSKVTALEDAPGDYLQSFRRLRAYGDYFVINVSSPNTPGLRDLQQTHLLKEIIHVLRRESSDATILVKLAPDLADEQVLECGEVAEEGRLSGIIATNTTLDHSSIPQGRDETGGLSGAPLQSRATQVLALLKGRTTLPIVASGGVMNAEIAKEKFDAGASLVQIYTGFVYRGPRLIREIAQGAG